MIMVVLTLVSSVSMASDYPRFPTEEEFRAPLLQELRRLGGPDAKSCGLFARGQAHTGLLECAEQNERDGSPYWVGVQSEGEDSMNWQAAVRTPDHKHFLITYDSNPSGAPEIRPRICRDTCGDFIFYPGVNSHIVCKTW